jgi:hypothetical protein
VPELAGPALVPLLAGPAEVFVEALPLDDPTPPVPVPDYSAAFTPVLEPLRVQVMVGRVISREVVGEFVTAYVEDWARDVDVLATTSAAIRISSWDPLLVALADEVSLSADGRLVYSWDPKGYIVWVYLDGVPVWTGVFRQPLDIGGGYHALPAVDPSAVFSERILGRPEQEDLLLDAGSFESYTSQADMEADGWEFDAGVTATIVSDGVRGTKALQLTGAGWASTPKVGLMGAEGYGRTVEGAAFGKWADTVESGTEVVLTRTRVASTLGEWDQEFTVAHAGNRPDDQTGWTDGPVPSGGILAPSVVAHLAWVDLRSFAGSNSRYDLVTIRQGITTGAPPGSSQDLTWYVERVFRDLHATGVGGSPTGLSTRLVNECGTEAVGMRWAHNQRTPFRDVLTMLLDRDGGPECRITTGWNFEITDRLGTDRDDIALSMWDITEAGWAVDPGAFVDDLVVDTGRGTGTSWISVTKSTAFDPLRQRIVSVITAPVDRTLNELDPWAQAFFDASARIQRTASVPVAWHVAEQITEGDTVWVTQHDGLEGMSQRMRVLTKRHRPMAMLVDCTLAPV